MKIRNMSGPQSPYIIDEDEFKKLNDTEKALLFMDREFINDVAQVIHLTTALFLMLIGSHLEYSKRSDLYIFFITLTVALVKLISCVQIINKSETLTGDKP